MKKKKYKNQKQQPLSAAEPQQSYGSKTFNIYHSFEEMNEADLRQMGSFSPLERLAHITTLLKNFYAEELKQKPELILHFK